MDADQVKLIQCHIIPCKAIKVFSLKHQQQAINILTITRFHHTQITIPWINLGPLSIDLPLSSHLIQCLKLISHIINRILDFFNRFKKIKQVTTPLISNFIYSKYHLCMRAAFFHNFKFFFKDLKPFVSVSFGNHTERTSVAFGGNPSWNEQIELDWEAGRNRLQSGFIGMDKEGRLTS